jgi:hypothetical protein
MQLIEIAAAKVAIGILLQSIAEDAPPSLPVRVPAKIEKRGRDSFCFHIKDDGSRQSVRGKQMMPAWKVATIAIRISVSTCSCFYCRKASAN